MTKKILTVVALITLAFSMSALDIVSVDTNDNTFVLNRTNFTGSVVSVKGVTFTNGTTMSDGVLIGTNSVIYTKNGTNYFIRLP